MTGTYLTNPDGWQQEMADRHAAQQASAVASVEAIIARGRYWNDAVPASGTQWTPVPGRPSPVSDDGSLDALETPANPKVPGVGPVFAGSPGGATGQAQQRGDGGGGSQGSGSGSGGGSQQRGYGGGPRRNFGGSGTPPPAPTPTGGGSAQTPHAARAPKAPAATATTAPATGNGWLGILVVVAIGVGLWWYFSHHRQQWHEVLTKLHVDGIEKL